jgi:hypothetical protein
VTTVSQHSDPLSEGIAFLQDAHLFDAFLTSVSHDLRSPLLTLSLTEERSFFSPEQRDEFVRAATREMSQMLDAVSAVSRARTNLLAPRSVPLADLLNGHLVISDDSTIQQVTVRVDPGSVDDVFRVIAHGEPMELRVTRSATHAGVSLALPGSLAAHTHSGLLALSDDPPQGTASPLHALLAWIKRYAGTPVASLAVAEVQMHRQGGSLSCSGSQVHIAIPLSRADAG